MFFTLVTRSSKTRRGHIGDPALEKSKPDGVNNIDESKPDEAKVAATKKLQSQRRKKPKKENFITKKIFVSEFIVLLPLLSEPGASPKNWRVFPSGN